MNVYQQGYKLKNIVLIIALVALLLAGASITAATAQSALPGDALYPVKTSIEQTRLNLARDAGDRAQMKMDFAQRRLEEIAALIEEGRYREVREAVLDFEADIYSAILELETISEVDPARAAQLALEITRALTRYAQTLSTLATSVPENVRPEVIRALDTTQIAGSLEFPSGDAETNGNENTNDRTGASSTNGNGNASLDNESGNANDNGDDRSENTNGNESGNEQNRNDNGDDGNVNDNDNGSYGGSNDNGDDDRGRGSNSNSNDNATDDSRDDSNDNLSDDGNHNTNDNANDDYGDDYGDNDGGGASDDGNRNVNDNGNANDSSGDDHGGDRDRSGSDDDDNGNNSGSDGHGGNGNDNGKDDD